MNRDSGFTLVELMVVVGIIAVLASVSVPAYINYQNRARQTDGIEALLRAKMDEQAFYADNNRYANTIGCLYSFGNTCAKTADTSRSYRITVSSAAANTIVVSATRRITVANTFDRVACTVTMDSARPQVLTPQALNFSIFNWIFK